MKPIFRSLILNNSGSDLLIRNGIGIGVELMSSLLQVENVSGVTEVDVAGHHGEGRGQVIGTGVELVGG